MNGMTRGRRFGRDTDRLRCAHGNHEGYGVESACTADANTPSGNVVRGRSGILVRRGLVVAVPPRLLNRHGPTPGHAPDRRRNRSRIRHHTVTLARDGLLPSPKLRT